MDIIQFIVLVTVMSLFARLIFDCYKARRDKDIYKILLESQTKSFNTILNQIYEIVKEENNSGILTCKYKIKEELKHLFPQLQSEIPICNLSKEDIVGE